jgi:hypothetical protein
MTDIPQGIDNLARETSKELGPRNETSDGKRIFLFRYENPQTPRESSGDSRDEFVGSWFTDSPKSLKTYIKARPPGGSIVVVEVEKDRLEALKAANHPVAKNMDIEPLDNYIIPPELLEGARTIPFPVATEKPKFQFKDWDTVNNGVDEIIDELQKPLIYSFISSQRPTEDFIHFATGLMGEVGSHNVGVQAEGVNKFVVNEQGKESLDYIIWWNRDTSYSNTYPPLLQEDWQALLKDRSTLDKTNEVLLRAKRAAQNFYPWEESHGGISVVNENTFGMEMSGPYGVRVSYVEAKRLIEAVKSGDEARIKEREIHLAASFVHEYIHIERDDFGYNNRKLEIVSHIGQFLYDPKGNEIFRSQIEQIITNLRRDGVDGNKDAYDMGTYTALVLIADELQRINSAFKALLDNDPDQYKFDSLERITEFVDNETRDSLKDAILDKSISASGDDLIKQFDQILSSWSSPEEKLGGNLDLIS